MQKFTATGEIVTIGEVQTFQSGFMKREIVLNVADAGSQYQDYAAFELTKDRVALVEGMKVGDSVTVEFVLNGRMWEGPNGVKYFNSLNAIKVYIPGERVPRMEKPTATDAAAEAEVDAVKTDDLPF